MNSKHSLRFTLVCRVGIPALTAAILLLSGVRFSAALFFLGGLTAILWWFTRTPRPADEEPCSAVSCCHYLEEPRNDNPPRSSLNKKKG